VLSDRGDGRECIVLENMIFVLLWTRGSIFFLLKSMQVLPVSEVKLR